MLFKDIPTSAPGIEAVEPIQVSDFGDLKTVIAALREKPGHGVPVSMSYEVAFFLDAIVRGMGLNLKSKLRYDGVTFLTAEKGEGKEGDLNEADFATYKASGSSSSSDKAKGARLPRGYAEGQAKKLYEKMKAGNGFLALDAASGFSLEQRRNGVEGALKKGKLLEKANLYLEENPNKAGEFRLKWSPDNVGKGKSLSQKEYDALKAAWEKDHKAGKADSWLVQTRASGAKAKKK